MIFAHINFINDNSGRSFSLLMQPNLSFAVISFMLCGIPNSEEINVYLFSSFFFPWFHFLHLRHLKVGVIF